jgi:hypothetical protein
MMMRRLMLVLVASAALAAGVTGNARADGFGSGVAACGQTMLGQRADPPAVTCSCEGTTMTFVTFGAMVVQMQR